MKSVLPTAQPCRGAYEAEATSDAVRLIARGMHPTTGFAVFFEAMPGSARRCMLWHWNPTGSVGEALTPFTVETYVTAADHRDTVEVCDASGCHVVPVTRGERT